MTLAIVVLTVVASLATIVFCAEGCRILAEKTRRCDQLEAERGYLMDLREAEERRANEAEKRVQQLTERAEAAEIDAARWQRESEQVVRIVWVPLMQEPGVEQ